MKLPKPNGASVPREYLGYVLNVMDKLKRLDQDIKDKSLNYGLNVVTKPLDELGFKDKIFRAAISPGRYYKEVEKSYIMSVRRVAKMLKKLKESETRQPNRGNWLSQLLTYFTSKRLAKS